MIISHTFEAGTPLKEKRAELYNSALEHLKIESIPLLTNSLINLRLKGTKCSIEFTEEYKRD